jgi:hypothetical protein
VATPLANRNRPTIATIMRFIVQLSWISPPG